MEDYKGLVIRLEHETKQTLGKFYLFNGLLEVFSCYVLELPDRQNQKSISRVLDGDYICVERWSKKYGWHYILQDVKGRSYILIHFGNYYTDTRGCLIFGNAVSDINKDGFRDVTSSKKTMQRLIAAAPKQFKLTIKST